MNDAWLRLSDGPPGQCVLAVDFDATGRPEATFRDLARAVPQALTLWLATPPPPGGSFLRWWSDQVPEPVTAVFGYCAGSSFAGALADEVEQRDGRRPTLVLFNPGPPTVRTIRRDFDAVFEAMAGLDRAERGALRARVHAATAGAEDVTQAGQRLLEIHRDTCRSVLPRLEIDPDVGEQLGELLASYVAYLTAALRLAPYPMRGPATSLLSREYDDADGIGTTIRFDVSRARLLADPQVAATVHTVLGTASRSGRTSR
jgi:hypothetical protein